MSTPTSWSLNLQYLMQGTGSGAAEWTSSHQCTSSGWGHSSCFEDEPETQPLPLPRDFSAPYSAPKFSPHLPHLISRSLHRQSLEELPNMSSSKLWGDARRKAWGRWRGKGERSASSQRKTGRRKVSSLPSLHFFFLHVFFSFLLLEKKKTMAMAITF